MYLIKLIHMPFTHILIGYIEQFHIYSIVQNTLSILFKTLFFSSQNEFGAQRLHSLLLIFLAIVENNTPANVETAVAIIAYPIIDDGFAEPY